MLRLATYELKAVADLPRNVTLDDAVERAKRVGGGRRAGSRYVAAPNCTSRAVRALAAAGAPPGSASCAHWGKMPYRMPG